MLLYSFGVTTVLAIIAMFFPVPIMLISIVAFVLFTFSAYKKPAFLAVTPWIGTALSVIVLVVSIISYVSRHLTWVA